MTKKIVFGVMLVALVAVVAVPSASAACIPAKSATTFSTLTAYWVPTDSTGSLVGQAWQLGSPGTYSSTGCPTFMTFDPGGVTLNLDLGSCGSGCPAALSTLATLAQHIRADGTSEFLLDTIVETPAATVNFDYATQGNHNMIPIPRPRVLSSARVATNVNLNVAVDSIAGGLYGPNAGSAVTGFRILTKSSAVDPGNDAANYDAVPAAVIANPGGTGASQPVVLNCTNPADQWIVTQIQFEGGTVLGGATSAATRVRCDPALANPKYKIVPKKIGAPRTVPN
jgi:hypothetical protein